MTNRDHGPMFFPPRNWSRRFGTQFFTIEIASVEITEDDKTAEKSAYYHIIVKRGKQVQILFPLFFFCFPQKITKTKKCFEERIVARRYSEFYEFHRLLVRFSSYARRCALFLFHFFLPRFLFFVSEVIFHPRPGSGIFQRVTTLHPFMIVKTFLKSTNELLKQQPFKTLQFR